MTLMEDDAIIIAAAGGGLRLPSNAYMTDGFIRIANAASRHGARINIVMAGTMMPDDMIRIGNAGKGAVQFELV